MFCPKETVQAERQFNGMILVAGGEGLPTKESSYRAEQVVFALRQAESGTRVPEVCCKMGISEQTFWWNEESGK